MGINNVEMAVVPDCKLVPDASVARKLLKDGYKIIDIKPKRNRMRETVFMFEVVPGFMEKLEEYSPHKKNVQ